MANVVTTNGSFICANAGTASVSAASSILKVDGNDIVIASDVIGSTISGCTNPTVPCTTVMSYTAGASIILKKGSSFVLLSGATFVTNGTAPLLIATDTQTKFISS